MDKLLIITGPTATGKTALGIEIAQKFNGEIISADSRQVYKFMDIGTGKDKNLFKKAGVKVWGLGLVDPDYPFNVSEYVKYATAVIKDIWKRAKLPVVVGGSGQYIKELIFPSETLNIKPNQKLRSQLSTSPRQYLQEKLQLVDPGRWQKMNSSDRNNPRRLVRAIEVAGQSRTQKPLSADVLILGLTAKFRYLFSRIDSRVDGRIQNGFEKEVAKLHELGYFRIREYPDARASGMKRREKTALVSPKETPTIRGRGGRHFPNAFGYRGETAQDWKYAEHNYARRQMTYLKKLPGIIWFDIQTNYKREIIAQVNKWYTTNDGSTKDQAGNG